MSDQKLIQYLDANRVKYVNIRHSPAYTAQEVAAAAHVPGREMAKTVMVKIDGRMAMAVLPASQKVDLGMMRAALGVDRVELASESEFRQLFPGCELGAMPPFGNLYGLPVFVDEHLAQEKQVVFQAGNHREAVRVNWTDFERAVHPTVADFCKH